MQYYFDGMLRFDPLFGNPNKMAVLLVSLMFVILFLLGRIKILNILILIIFAIFAYLVFETYSRGGIVAFSIGLFIVLWGAFKTKDRYNFFLLLSALIFSITLVFFHPVQHRISPSFVSGDMSIINRLALWKGAAAMIFDAPWGWGEGMSGHAYVQWYQPLHSSQEYRTMVGSHLTYFVEHSFFARYIYTLIWFFIICSAFPSIKQLRHYVAYAIAVAFFIGGLFSSVFEEAVLWIIPGCAIIYLLIVERTHIFTLKKFVPSFIGANLLFCIILAFSFIFKDPSSVYKSINSVRIGEGPNLFLVVADTSVFGRNYGKDIREIILNDKDSSFFIVDSLCDVPSGMKFKKSILSGHFINDGSLQPFPAGEVVFVNPLDSPSKVLKVLNASNVRLVKGALLHDICNIDDNSVIVEEFSGRKKYIPFKDIYLTFVE